MDNKQIKNELIKDELRKIARRVTQWRVELQLLILFSGWLICFLIGAWSDVFIKFGFSGRVILWSVLMVVLAVGVYKILGILTARHSPFATAALLERHFPQLDNHLINYLQFAAVPQKSAAHKAYLQQEAPELHQVEWNRMHDTRRARRGYAAVFGLTLMVAGSFVFSGENFQAAAQRVLNPFAGIEPPTAAALISVSPGDTQVVVGTQLQLTCTVDGRKGQTATLELRPESGDDAVIQVGELRGGGEEKFSYQIDRVTEPLAYRFQVGDASPSKEYKVTTAPPLALDRLELRIEPPSYTGKPVVEADAFSEIPDIPISSEVSVQMTSNRKTSRSAILLGGNREIEMRPAGGNTGKAKIADLRDESMTVVIESKEGERLRSDIKYRLIKDSPPSITIRSPQGKALLKPTQSPAIEFTVADDYGVAEVLLKRMDDADQPANSGETIAEWKPGEETFSTQWQRDTIGITEELVYLVVARDNAVSPNQTVSEPIVFVQKSVDREEPERKQANDQEPARFSIQKLVDRQRQNLQTTQSLNREAANTTAEQWRQPLDEQEEIRELTKRLLDNQYQVLGPLGAVVVEVYRNQMPECIRTLRRAKEADTAERDTAGRAAAQLQSRILYMLTHVDSSAEKVERHQNITDLFSALEQIIKGQEATRTKTRNQLQLNQSGNALAPMQDQLFYDFTDFLRKCDTQASALDKSNAEFAQLLRTTTAEAENRQINKKLLTAAEHLENDKLTIAVNAQSGALEDLNVLAAMLNDWRRENVRERTEEAKKLAGKAKDRLHDMADLQTKIVESMRAMQNQGDKTGDEEIKELYLELENLKQGMSEALLEIARDLQIFPELPVANETVKDVYQIYEKVSQTEGSESAESSELGVQKEDWILEKMKKAEERIADMEQWLHTEPDNIQRNPETFDKEEMPDIAKAPLGDELQDIIGDLLEQQEDIREESHDAATNQGMADMPAGWEIAEGEHTNYSAKGSSGNVRPDHKEQDGRSNIGREGMSSGEIAAASGMIHEGDEDIEKRMTRDPAQGGHVEEMGHSEAKATGGGKVSGSSEETGMPGEGPRRINPDQRGSPLGMQAMLRENSEALYAQASMQYLRVGKLDSAVRYMKRTENAMEQGIPVGEVMELQARAIRALQETQTELKGDGSIVSLAERTMPSFNDEEYVATSADTAPAEFRELVSEYFKSLNRNP